LPNISFFGASPFLWDSHKVSVRILIPVASAKYQEDTQVGFENGKCFFIFFAILHVFFYLKLRYKGRYVFH